MNIAIIGIGNVGTALAKGWATVGHRIHLGGRNPKSEKAQRMVEVHANISSHEISEAAQLSEIILIATPSTAIRSVIENLGDTHGKFLIDATNSVSAKPEPYQHATEALLELCPEAHIVKCFNTTGFENMADPHYGELRADMFMAGDSDQAKEVASQLAKDLGFAQVYDFGGSDKIPLIEQFAMAWINLAIMQGEGRDMAFKILKR